MCLYSKQGFSNKILYSIQHILHISYTSSFAPIILEGLCEQWYVLLCNILNSSLTLCVLVINIFSAFWQFFYIPGDLTFLKVRTDNSYWTAWLQTLVVK